MLALLSSLIFALLLLSVCLLILTVLFLKLAPTFGGKPDTTSTQRIQKSLNFDGKKFNNLSSMHDNPMAVEDIHLEQEVSLLKTFFFPPLGKNPSRQKPLISQPLEFDKESANTLENGQFVWLGHSTVLFRTIGKTIITDPVFHHASPVPFLIKPFLMTNLPKVEELPFIDMVLISHDHYDHLDYLAIKKMKERVGHFYVPLGVKAHLVRWGVNSKKVSEFDWYEELIIDNQLKLAFTPTKHYSGRGITNHRSSLWGSWVVKSTALSVYFSGDGGYSSEFAKIGEKYGSFDIAFIEDGAYNVRWQDVHMLPEQSAQAGIDVGAKVILPIHWGKFDLSTHHWTDPIKRIRLAMEAHNADLDKDNQIQITTPKIGQIFSLDKLPKEEWWN